MSNLRLYRKACNGEGPAMRNATITAFARSTHGTSAVEVALLSPLYFLLMAGMAAYGLYLGTSHSLQQVAADAARAAIAGLSADERHEIALDYVAANAGTYPLIEAEHLTVGARDGEAGRFVVSLDYDARSLPIWNLFDGLPLPQVTIVRRAAIRIGGF